MSLDNYLKPLKKEYLLDDQLYLITMTILLVSDFLSWFFIEGISL